MRKTFLCSLILLVWGATANAQDLYSKVDIFAGYSYFSASPKTDRIPDPVFAGRINQHGFGANLSFNISERIGVVADFSNQTADKTIIGLNTDTATLLYLFGGRFYARSEGIKAYAQALIGGARRRAFSKSVDISAVDLALAFGGGVEVDINKRFGFRMVEFDYVPTRGGDGTLGIGRRWSQNFRAEAGLVLRFGY